MDNWLTVFFYLLNRWKMEMLHDMRLDLYYSESPVYYLRFLWTISSHYFISDSIRETEHYWWEQLRQESSLKLWSWQKFGWNCLIRNLFSCESDENTRNSKALNSGSFQLKLFSNTGISLRISLNSVTSTLSLQTSRFHGSYLCFFVTTVTITLTELKSVSFWRPCTAICKELTIFLINAETQIIWKTNCCDFTLVLICKLNASFNSILSLVLIAINLRLH